MLISPGCRSPRSAERGPPPPPQIPLAAESTYLDGAILVTAEFGPFHLDRPQGASAGAETTESSRATRSERPERGSGGMGGGGGGRRPPGEDSASGAGGGMRRAGGGGGGPSVMRGPLRQSLSITLENTSDQPVQLRVAEVKSLLGNIVPEPETFTLEPGATQTLTPMRAGIRESVTEFHVTLRLRTAEANETQTLVLKPAPSDDGGT